MAPTRAVRKLASAAGPMTLPEREAVPGIGPRRAEIIVAGAQVFAELLESFGLEGFRYSPLGLRDGILAQMLAEQDARATRPSRVRARALGERAGHGAALRRRSAPGRAGARPRGAAFPRAEGRCTSCRRSMKAGWPPRPCCATPASSSTTRAITGTRSTLFRVRRSTATRRCSGRWFRPLRATWARAARSRATARCATFPPTSTATCSGRWCCCGWPWRSTRTAPAMCCASRRGSIPSGFIWRWSRDGPGAELELWSLRKEADYFREVFGRELFCTLA